MFAYCLNNPVNFVDPSGQISISISLLGGIALACGLLLIARAMLTDPKVQESISEVTDSLVDATDDLATKIKENTNNLKEKIDDSKEKVQNRTYSVYFLQDDKGVVQYVGRVTDSGYKARMTYHFITRGLTPAKRIQGLSWEVARGLEEVGMIECHTINASNPINNQIHGISSRNKNGERYMIAASEYLANRIENDLLNFLGI